MVKMTSEQAAATTMIQHLVNAWASELDNNNGLAMGPLLSEDCAYVTRGVVRQGRAGAIEFYNDRIAELGGIDNAPSQRHVISNLLVDFSDDDHARITFLLTYYFAMQKLPVVGFDGPAAIADCRMDVVRDGEGEWRIASFDSEQSFRKA